MIGDELLPTCLIRQRTTLCEPAFFARRDIHLYCPAWRDSRLARICYVMQAPPFAIGSAE